MKTEEIFNILQLLIKSQNDIDAKKIYIAGGCLRNYEDPNDIDIFCENDKDRDLLVNLFKKLSNKECFESDFAFTFSLLGIDKPIQIVKLTGNIIDIINGFDFNVNQKFLSFAYPFSYSKNEAEIKITENTRFPQNTLGRLIKFSEEGFFFSPETLKRAVELTLSQREDKLTHKIFTPTKS